MGHIEQLKENTVEAYNKGAWGLPCFWVSGGNRRNDDGQADDGRLFSGQDRMHLLEAEILSRKMDKPLEKIPQLERLHPRCLRTPPENRVRKLKFWFDFSSQWSYIAFSQLDRLQLDAGESLQIELKPFLLGALFKMIDAPGGPNFAAFDVYTPNQLRYSQQDLKDWANFWSACNRQEYPPLPPIDLKFPKDFPFRTVTALRIAILEPKTVGPIFRAAWSQELNISSPAVLAEVLTANGFNGKKIIADVSPGSSVLEAVKKRLSENTQQAFELGMCGAPTFQIGNRIVWGQDRLNVVQDLIAGWDPDHSNLKATVGAFPHFDYRL